MPRLPATPEKYCRGTILEFFGIFLCLPHPIIYTEGFMTLALDVDTGEAG